MRTEAPPVADHHDATQAIAPVSVLDELLTAKQVAQLLQVPASTVEDYARRGILPSLKLGRHRRFIRSEIEETLVALLDPERHRRRRRHRQRP